MQQLEMLEKTDERKCCVCKEVKKEEEFTYHKIQGRQSQCKECRKELNKKYNEENKEKCLAMRRDYYKRNKDRYRELSRLRNKNSVKGKAVNRVNAAIKSGKLVRQPCEECGAEKAEGHHDDYAKPLEVRWLCRSHHKQWHAKYGEALNACTVRHWTPPKEAQK